MNRIKLRMKNWYWGNFVTKPLPFTSITDYEPYTEELHGWHHSEEFKTGHRKLPYNKGASDL